MHAITKILRDLVAIPSPTGFTTEVIQHVDGLLQAGGWQTRLTRKGALLALPGGKEPELMFSAHVDTLGAMVSSLEGGTIRITQLGGWPIPSFEGEYITLRTMDGVEFRGTLLLDNPATHVNREVGNTKRTLENVHIRLDVQAASEDNLRRLGIDVGDPVIFDPRFEAVDTGFVRSRFLDDKAGTACLIHAALELGPGCGAGFYFSTYEEVGHGASGGIPDSVRELVAVDMGVVGHGVTGDECKVSICAKDSSGPYDAELRHRLTKLARQQGIPHTVDVFPYYGSDASAALRAGCDLRAALIGPGVSASHGVERTHERALAATADLVMGVVGK